MTQFTANEVRAWFEGMVEQGLVDELTLQYGLAFADLLEAREKAVPVAWRSLSLPTTFICDAPKNLDCEKWQPLYTQPPAASVTDAMVEDGCMAWNKSAGLGYAVADRDCMRAAIEAALAAQENPNG